MERGKLGGKEAVARRGLERKKRGKVVSSRGGRGSRDARSAGAGAAPAAAQGQAG